MDFSAHYEIASLMMKNITIYILAIQRTPFHVDKFIIDETEAPWKFISIKIKCQTFPFLKR